MKLIYGLVGILMLAGCGKGVDTDVSYTVAPDFAEYAADFDKSGSAYGAPKARVTIEYGDTQGMSARCNRPLIGNRVVVIDRDIWAKLSTTAREVVILHELGHCILNREHVDSERSLMNPAPIGLSKEFLKDPAPFIEELFSP